MKIKENFIWEYQRYYFTDYKLKYFNSNRYIIENNRCKENELKFWSDSFNYIYDLTFKRFSISFNYISSSREYKSKYLIYMFLVSFTYAINKNEVDDDEYNYYHSKYHDYNIHLNFLHNKAEFHAQHNFLTNHQIPQKIPYHSSIFHTLLPVPPKQT